MVDQIEKVLRKADLNERREIEHVIVRLTNGDLLGLQIKKIQGEKNIYRTRTRDFRIIFSMENGKMKELLFVKRRSESTYRDL